MLKMFNISSHASSDIVIHSWSLYISTVYIHAFTTPTKQKNKVTLHHCKIASRLSFGDMLQLAMDIKKNWLLPEY